MSGGLTNFKQLSHLEARVSTAGISTVDVDISGKEIGDMETVHTSGMNLTPQVELLVQT